jgi:hypothetical protein
MMSTSTRPALTEVACVMIRIYIMHDLAKRFSPATKEKDGRRFPNDRAKDSATIHSGCSKRIPRDASLSTLSYSWALPIHLHSGLLRHHRRIFWHYRCPDRADSAQLQSVFLLTSSRGSSKCVRCYASTSGENKQHARLIGVSNGRIACGHKVDWRFKWSDCLRPQSATLNGLPATSRSATFVCRGWLDAEDAGILIS